MPHEYYGFTKNVRFLLLLILGLNPVRFEYVLSGPRLNQVYDLTILQEYIKKLNYKLNMKMRILQSSIVAILSFSLIISINATFAESENNTDSNFANLPEISDASVPRGGFIQVLFATDPVYPDTTNQTNLEFDFVNKEINSIQQDVDYKISINQGSNEVYVMPITHTSQGSVSFPFQFKNPGEYQIVVGIYGISFKKIPLEVSTFTITVLPPSTSSQTTSLDTSQNSISNNQSSQGTVAQKSSSFSGQEISTPEFGSMVGIISICSIIGMIAISRKFNYRIL